MECTPRTRTQSSNIMVVQLNELPDEIIEFILTYLPPYKDLEQCSLVCKRWNEIVKSKFESLHQTHQTVLRDLYFYFSAKILLTYNFLKKQMFICEVMLEYILINFYREEYITKCNELFIIFAMKSHVLLLTWKVTQHDTINKLSLANRY